MPDTSAKTFPGVYTSVTDKSFLPVQVSRFRPALVGVTSKGPLDTPTQVRTLKEFLQIFGTPVVGQTGDDVVDYYLADAVALTAEYTSATTVVRVANKYTEDASVAVSGTNTSEFFTAGAGQGATVTALKAGFGSSDLWVRLREDGKATTVANVVNVSGDNVWLDPETPLQDAYANATFEYSKTENAANEAEGVLEGYEYATVASVTAVGAKNAFSFTVTGAGTVTVGDIFQLTQAGKVTTSEFQVEAVINGTVMLKTTDNSQTGYQAVALQDTYDAATLQRVTSRDSSLFLRAKTPGEWANGANAKSGLYVRVRPGSAPGSKRLEVFENGGLVETLDNIFEDGYEDALVNSQYVSLVHVSTTVPVPANTRAPWDSNSFGLTVGSSINAGLLISTAGTQYSTGGQFTGGANGNNAQESDYMGVYDPVNDTYTGLRSLEDEDNVDVNLIACPLNFNNFTGNNATKGVALMQRLSEVAGKINALAIVDVPPALNSQQAVDWHNGTGLYTGRARIDSARLALYWNWWTGISRFTNQAKEFPPTLAALRCFGYTFQRDQPWYAAAGETRGWIPEALDVEFDRVSVDARHAMYGAGNAVNPILKLRGRFYVYGERTLQRVESKLSAVHSVVLVNTVVKGLAEIGRRFVFDPNDQELLVHIRLAFSEYLDKIRNQRGIEEYELVVDERNNTADTRNRREVIVDLSLIPTDVAERIFINATVRESGATLGSVTA